MLKAEWSGSEWAACVLAGLSAKVNPPGLPIAFAIHDHRLVQGETAPSL
jgi:hypothetical protein